MPISKAFLSIAGLTAVAAILINLPTSLIMSSEKATVQYLQTAKLQTIDSTKQNFSVSWNTKSYMAYCFSFVKCVHSY
jgi:hypothetical protein